MTERNFIDETEGEYDLEGELEIYLPFFTTDVIKKINEDLLLEV